MKFIFALAILFIGAVAAQAPAPADNNRALVESLEKRATALLARVHAVAQEHRAQFGHLLQALDRQAVLVEALALDLKAQLTDATRQHQLHHIHTIEEELLSLENRVSEEIEIISHVRAGRGVTGQTGAQLIARGQQLIKEGQATVAKLPHAREVKEIQSEIIVIESLVKAIQAKPAPTAAELKKDEEELARQEQTLKQLIDKAGRRH